MATLKKYDYTGKTLKEEVSVEDSLLKESVNKQAFKQYMVAIQANARQWSANTKVRKEVKATGKKPHRQKGTGSARQGCFAAPQYRGGGVVFGPRTKWDQRVKVNKKHRLGVIQYLLSQKIAEQHLHVMQDKELETPKTKVVANFLQKLDFLGKRILFLASHVSPAFVQSMRNIPKVEFQLIGNASGYSLTLAQEVIVLDSALGNLKEILGKNNEKKKSV
ncbi:MAG: 50S ribosomal protein L4 [Parachlamydiales bacterium]|nr:50S ribosomal protein L4 [Parachlamydiales bacterium]